MSQKSNPRRSSKHSMKDSLSSIKGSRAHISPRTNLGHLMTKHRNVDEVLYSYTSHSEWVFEEMDFTIEEFADMTGADVEDLVNALQQAIKGS